MARRKKIVPATGTALLLIDVVNDLGTGARGLHMRSPRIYASFAVNSTQMLPAMPVTITGPAAATG
jgi:hypothetical protein